MSEKEVNLTNSTSSNFKEFLFNLLIMICLFAPVSDMMFFFKEYTFDMSDDTVETLSSILGSIASVGLSVFLFMIASRIDKMELEMPSAKFVRYLAGGELLSALITFGPPYLSLPIDITIGVCWLILIAKLIQSENSHLKTAGWWMLIYELVSWGFIIYALTDIYQTGELLRNKYLIFVAIVPLGMGLTCFRFFLEGKNKEDDGEQ